MLESFLVSTGLVALAEIGDKTQLLSLVLAARFGKPWPIVAGILAATLANHAAAALLGAWITSLVGAGTMTKVAGASFLLMAAWVLIPDKLDGAGADARRGSVFVTTATLFFIAEMGDKTQVATVMLAARYDSLAAVILGTTLGMIAANAPVVFFGDAIAKRFPLAVIRRVTAALFAILGVLALVPEAKAQDLTVAAGATRATSGERSHGLLVSYSHELAPYLSASYSYRNEGHIPSHHRDGHGVQVWGSTHDGEGFALRAGVGAYRFFDTTVAESPVGFANAHGWAGLYSIAATWRTPGRRWGWELRVDRIHAHDSFDATQFLLGAVYRLDQDGSLRSNAPPREFGPTENEVAVMAGRTIVNSFESEGARAGVVEYRHTFRPAVRGSLAWIHEGDARLTRRDGVVAQLWLEPSFGGDRFTFGVGAGPYVAIDRVRDASRVLGLVGTTFSYHFARGWSARITWNRVSSSYDRDSDIVTAGIAYRF